MDSKINRIAPPDPLALRRMSDRRRERKFVLPRREDDEAADDGAAEDEPSVVLEPRPRADGAHVAVSRAHLDDEAGQRIDLQG